MSGSQGRSRRSVANGEDAGQTSDHKRATWVALRTLRQRPRVVDHQKNGDPIFEIRAVRLMLRDGADHFNRLARCSKCGREVPGAPVLAQADLTRPSQSVICKECVRTATRGPRWEATARHDDRSVSRPAAPENSPPPPASAVVTHAVAPADDGRVAAIESQLAVVLARLTELADGQESESKQRREADDAVQSQMRAAVLKGLQQVRAELAPPADGPSLVAALEDRVGQNLAGMVELVQSQRSELGALGMALAETRAELERVARSNRELAVAQTEAERRVTELTISASGPPSAAALRDAFQVDLEKAEVRLTHAADVQRAELVARLTDAFRGEIAGVEARLARGLEDGSSVAPVATTEVVGEAVRVTVADAEARLARAAEAQREELRAALTGHLTEAFRAEIAQAEARLAQAAEAERAALHATLAEGLSQAGVEAAAVEHRLLLSITALTQSVESQRDELGSALTAHVAREMASVVGAVRELGHAREQMHATMNDLLQRTVQAEAGLRDLAASTEAGAGRLHAVEQNTRRSLDRMTGLLATELRREGAQAAEDQAASERGVVATGGSLLDALDRQLQQAERRLAWKVTSGDMQ